MTIKHLGGIFGRTPTFDNVTIEGTIIGGDVTGTVNASGAVLARGGVTVNQTNAGGLDMSGNSLRIRSWGATAGTGVMDFRTGGGGGSGDSQALRIDSSQNLLIGGTQKPASSQGNLALFNGTAPTGSVTNGIVLYAEDVSASSELKVRDEAGNVTTLSPHNFELIPEGPSEDLAWSYYSEKDGKRINVDMLKAIRVLEKMSGEQLVYED